MFEVEGNFLEMYIFFFGSFPLDYIRLRIKIEKKIQIKLETELPEPSRTNFPFPA